MKPSILTQLKVPFGLKQAANKKGIYNAVEFYYKLKTVNVHGTFDKETIVSFLSQKFNYSVQTIKKYIKRLKELQFLFEDGNFLCLIGYDKFWGKVFDKPDDKTSIRLFKIRPNEDLNISIHYNELKRNLRRQRKQAIKNYIRQECHSFGDAENYARKLRKLLAKQFSSTKIVNKLIKEQLKTISRTLTSFAKSNYLITVTCNKAAEIFGYSSAMQGSLILDQLKRKNLIAIKKQKPIYLFNISREAYSCLNLDKSFVYINGKIFKFVPNIITIL